MNENIYLKNGLFLFLTCLILQSCTTYSVLPKNISSGYAIEGVYSNHKSDYTARYIWGRAVFKWKYYHPENANGITVKVEIVNPKLLEFSFYKNGEYFGMKRLKGKFKNDSCFYSRRTFSIIPLFPLLFEYVNKQKRVYRVDDELIIEITENTAGGSIFLKPPTGHDKFNDILRFKQIED
jgi:hypothetical protein